MPTEQDRTRPRSYEITDRAADLLVGFKKLSGVAYKRQMELILEFLGKRAEASDGQFFSLILRHDFDAHAAHQMVRLLAKEFDLRLDAPPEGIYVRERGRLQPSGGASPRGHS